MDKHLNIFQAYHSGNQGSPDEVNRLEDNLIRCLEMENKVKRNLREKIS